MSRGPVGSLRMPERAGEFEMFEGEGFIVYVHRDTLAAAETANLIRFNFGAFGWCDLRLESLEVPR